MNKKLITGQKYKVKFPKKNKFNELGDFINELGGFFNEWFFSSKISLSSSNFLPLPPDCREMIITLKEYEYGGKIEVYAQVDQTTDDFHRIYASCDYFAKQGAKTLIYPHFTETVTNPDYVSIFASLRYTRYWGKCPDFTVNGVWYEHEGYDTGKDLTNPNKRADTFSKMMNRGIKQSERIIVEDCQVGRRWAKKNIYNRVRNENQNIVEVYIRTDNCLELLYKKEAG